MNSEILKAINALETEKYERGNNLIVVDFPVRSDKQQPPEKANKNELKELSAENQSQIVEFTDKEMNLMPKNLRTEFKKGKIHARIRQKPNGSYEIRCVINHTPISVCAKQVGLAKQKLLDKISMIDNTQPVSKSVQFTEYVRRWLDVAKKPYIKDCSFQEYVRLLQHDIVPHFGKIKIGELNQLYLQAFINKFTADGKFRTADKLAQILRSVCEYAVNDGVIPRSPMGNVKTAIYEEKHGTALSYDEEKRLIDELRQTPTVERQAFVFCLYTGLRRSELAFASIDGEWVTVKTAKQRKGLQDKYRKIPIVPMLRSVMEFIRLERIKKLRANFLTCKFPKIVGNHHFHDLRHTFITRCQEYGIPRQIVSLWAGHSADNSITSQVYTHLENNLDLQLKEAAKFEYKL